MGTPQTSMPPPAVNPIPSAAPQDDFFDLFGGAPAAPPAAAPPAGAPIYPIVLPGDKGQGLSIGAQFSREGGNVVYNLSIANNSPGPVDGFMIQINTNSFGLQPANQVKFVHHYSENLLTLSRAIYFASY